MNKLSGYIQTKFHQNIFKTIKVTAKNVKNFVLPGASTQYKHIQKM